MNNFDYSQEDQDQEIRNTISHDPNHNYHAEQWSPCEITLIDYGTALKYMVEDSSNAIVHRPNVTGLQFYLNPLFASKHTIAGNRASRRDDIIMIVYNMIYLLNPEDSWMRRIQRKVDSPYQMAQFKK